MRIRIPLLTAIVSACLIAASSTAFAADGESWTRTVPIGDPPGPGGVFGINGFDVFAEQAVAARVTVPADGDMRFVRAGLWLMNNSETEQRRVRLTLQTDALDEGGSETLPSGVVLE